MRWKGRRGSENVQDRRAGGGARKVAMGGGVGGIGLLIIVGVFALLGGDPRAILQNLQQSQVSVPAGEAQGDGAETSGPDDEMKEFVSVVLADTEEVWQQLFREMGRQYQEPSLVLFRDQVRSACGFASAASGPFYCPGDQQVYIDLAFFEELARRFKAPGDFAQAYVIAHEIGHHVQRLLGTTDQVHDMKGRVSDIEYNELSVKLELQADFFAGVWAHHADRRWQILEDGDVEEAFRAAGAIGDDRIQMRSRGYVVPESFTHGTSEQRLYWFRRGLETGDLSQGNTFDG